MPRVIINDSSENELFTASNPGEVSLAAGATSKVDANIQVGDVDVSASNPMPVDVQLVANADWTTLINAVRLDDDPTSYNSAALDVDGLTMVALLVDIDSTLAPTDIRLLIQFSDDGGTTWWDFEEGLFASLYWEDTATASGINKAFVVPVAGFDDMRVRAVATGTDATNYFDVTVKARPFVGAYSGAHA